MPLCRSDASTRRERTKAPPKIIMTRLCAIHVRHNINLVITAPICPNRKGIMQNMPKIRDMVMTCSQFNGSITARFVNHRNIPKENSWVGSQSNPMLVRE
jgi:hypothetical protein